MKKKRNVMSILKMDRDEILLKMKLLTLLIFAAFVSASASSYSQSVKFNLNMKNASIIDVFQKIREQSDFAILYDEKTLNVNRKVDVIVTDETVDKILDQIFEGQKDAYQIFDRQILISKMNEISKIPPSEIKNIEVQQPQKKDLSGIVKDPKGLTLPGVTVAVKGTTLGTITDNEGNFKLSVPADTKILVFSFVGMKAQEISVIGKSIFSVVMSEEVVAMEDVVVVGYGKQKKESVVGSIVQTGEKELLRSGNATSIEQALTGLLPGVVSILSSGEPGGVGNYQATSASGWNMGAVKRSGSASNIYIRGMNTWNGGNPLVLVDGVERSMDNIDMKEVENVSVLKDASATAVFGVKGANGVIQITTKRGALGKPVISFSYNTTAMMLSKVPEELNSYDAILMRNEAIERELAIRPTSWAEFKPQGFALNYKRPVPNPVYNQVFPDVNWQDALFKKVGFEHHANISVKGGTDFVRYFGSFAFLSQDDMFRKDYTNGRGYEPSFAFNRFNFRSNFDFSLTKTTNMALSLSGFQGRKNQNYAGVTDFSWIYGGLYYAAPDLFPPQNANGSFGWNPLYSNGNPLSDLYNLGVFQQRETEINIDLSLTQKLDFIANGLSAKALISMNNNFLSTGGLYDNATLVRPETGTNTQSVVIDPTLFTGPGQNPADYTSYMPVSSLTRPYYDFSVVPWVLRPENVDGSLLSRSKLYQFQLDYSRKFGKHSVGLLGLFKRQENAWGSEFKHYREDWVFRGTYDYDSKYLFETNGAYNGSEQFGPNYRFAFFPSVALGWVVSNEKFFKISWMNRLKFRLSGGLVGDDNVSGSRWLYADQITPASTAVPMNAANVNTGRSPYKGYDYSVIGNPDIHWEKARKYNFGLESGLFDNLVSITYDYFTEHRTDMLLSGDQRAIAPYFGATAPAANLGEVDSHGYELELKFDKRMANGLHPWATFAMSHTKNKILFKDDPALLPSYLKAEGYAVDQQRTQVRAGMMNNWNDIYASAPLEASDNQKIPGFWNIIDFNGDGVITANDVVPYNYSQVPQNTYSTSFGADYKGFSVMLMFYGVNNVTRNYGYSNFYANTDLVFINLLDAWSKDNQNASTALPRWRSQGGSIGDYTAKDGSYLRLKTVEFAYTFRDKWIKKVNLSALRVYLNGNNLFLWTNLPDDREASFVGGTSSVYPAVKRINLGIDVTF